MRPSTPCKGCPLCCNRRKNRGHFRFTKNIGRIGHCHWRGKSRDVQSYVERCQKSQKKERWTLKKIWRTYTLRCPYPQMGGYWLPSLSLSFPEVRTASTVLKPGLIRFLDAYIFNQGKLQTRQWMSPTNSSQRFSSYMGFPTPLYLTGIPGLPLSFGLNYSPVGVFVHKCRQHIIRKRMGHLK